MDYVNDIQKKNRILKVKNSLLEIDKDFTELRDRKLRDRDIKIRKEIQELFFKPVNISIDDMDKSQEKNDEEGTVCEKYLVELVN